MKGLITCQQLTKKYKGTIALNELSFSLEPNKLYGLLGRNGAGKTTLLHLLNAELLQTSGSLLIDGKSPYENSEILKELCFIKESQNFKKNMTVSEVLDIASLFYCHWDRTFALELIEKFDLPMKKKVKVLSKGMESALGIIVGLASRAPITIFDEPYIGLDAVSRQIFYDILLQDYLENPRTIILSTHLIDEVSTIFEKVVIIDKGAVLLIEEADTLRESAFYVKGATEKVSRFTKGMDILHSETLGNRQVMAVYGSLSKEQKQQAEVVDITIESVPIQQLMVYLTTKTKDRKGNNQMLGGLSNESIKSHM